MLDADTTLPPVASCRDAAGLTRFLSDLWAAVGRSEDLAYLARVIDQCEHRIGRSAAEMCHFYVLRGEALLRVKELVGHGGWLPWLAENTGYSPRQAQKYMRAARHRERLANAPSGTHLNGLLDLLVERDDDPGPDGTIRAEVGPVAEPEPLPAVEIQATEEDERPRAEPGRDVRPAPVTLSTGEVEWHTPADILEAVRLLWDGGIDLDPASSNTAQETVRARTYYTKDDDGLTRPWFDHVFLNPPYDAVAPFVAKLLADIDAGRVSEAVLLVHARTSTRWFHAVLSACDALCFASKKIRFLRPDGSVALQLSLPEPSG